MPLPHDNKINVFIRKSPDGKHQQTRGITKKESDDQSCSALSGLASRLSLAFLHPLTEIFLLVLLSEFSVSEMESWTILPLKSPRCCRARGFQV